MTEKMNDREKAEKAALIKSLEGATEAVNKESANYIATKTNGAGLSAVGEDNAKRLRAIAERTAKAVQDQASERLAVAESMVAEAKALIDRANGIAESIRQAADVEAKRSIDIAVQMSEAVTMMEEFRKKFVEQEAVR